MSMAGDGVTDETKLLERDVLCSLGEGEIGKTVGLIVFCDTGYEAESTFSNLKD